MVLSKQVFFIAAATAGVFTAVRIDDEVQVAAYNATQEADDMGSPRGFMPKIDDFAAPEEKEQEVEEEAPAEASEAAAETEAVEEKVEAGGDPESKSAQDEVREQMEDEVVEDKMKHRITAAVVENPSDDTEELVDPQEMLNKAANAAYNAAYGVSNGDSDEAFKVMQAVKAINRPQSARSAKEDQFRGQVRQPSAISAWRAAHHVMEDSHDMAPAEALVAAQEAQKAQKVRNAAKFDSKEHSQHFVAKKAKGCPCKTYLAKGTINMHQMKSCIAEHGCDPDYLDLGKRPARIATEGSDAEKALECEEAAQEKSLLQQDPQQQVQQQQVQVQEQQVQEQQVQEQQVQEQQQQQQQQEQVGRAELQLPEEVVDQAHVQQQGLSQEVQQLQQHQAAVAAAKAAQLQPQQQQVQQETIATEQPASEVCPCNAFLAHGEIDESDFDGCVKIHNCHVHMHRNFWSPKQHIRLQVSKDEPVSEEADPGAEMSAEAKIVAEAEEAAEAIRSIGGNQAEAQKASEDVYEKLSKKRAEEREARGEKLPSGADGKEFIKDKHMTEAMSDVAKSIGKAATKAGNTAKKVVYDEMGTIDDQDKAYTDAAHEVLRDFATTTPAYLKRFIESGAVLTTTTAAPNPMENALAKVNQEIAKGLEEEKKAEAEIGTLSGEQQQQQQQQQ